MEYSSAVEERGGTYGCTWYSRSNLYVSLAVARSNLPRDPWVFVLMHTTTELTLERPGDGVASVLMINVSFSVWKGFAGRSKVDPLTFTGCRTGIDHIPRAPPIACILRFVLVGKSLFERHRWRRRYATCDIRHSKARQKPDAPAVT